MADPCSPEALNRHRREVDIREYHADVVALAFVEEVSVLSPSVKPREPCAEVLSLRPIEKKPASGAVAGEPSYEYRPPVWDKLERIVGYRLTDANFEQAVTETSRSPLESTTANTSLRSAGASLRSPTRGRSFGRTSAG